jgi:hypothetical protein
VRSSSNVRLHRWICDPIALTSPYALPSRRERRGKTGAGLSPIPRPAQYQLKQGSARPSPSQPLASRRRLRPHPARRSRSSDTPSPCLKLRRGAEASGRDWPRSPDFEYSVASQNVSENSVRVSSSSSSLVLEIPRQTEDEGRGRARGNHTFFRHALRLGWTCADRPFEVQSVRAGPTGNAIEKHRFPA